MKTAQDELFSITMFEGLNEMNLGSNGCCKVNIRTVEQEVEENIVASFAVQDKRAGCVMVCCLCPCRCLTCVSAIGRCSSRRPRLRQQQRLRQLPWQGTFRVQGASGASLLQSVSTLTLGTDRKQSQDTSQTLHMGLLYRTSQRFEHSGLNI